MTKSKLIIAAIALALTGAIGVATPAGAAPADRVATKNLWCC